MRTRVATAIALFFSVAAVVLSLGSAPVSAHTDFESSSPAAGESVDAPVAIVTIVFTGDSTPVGDEFVALTPDGVVQTPTSVETLDNRTFQVTFDPPLAGGDVGVRWNVQSGDGHPIEGAFSFTVNAPVSTTAPAATAPATSAPPTPESASGQPADTSGGNAILEPVNPDADAATPAEVAATTPPPRAVPADAASTQTLDEFLAVDDSMPGSTTGTIGRIVGFLGVALGLGVLAFVGLALSGQLREVRGGLRAVQACGALVVVGAAIEYVGMSRIGAESLSSVWSTSPGFATVLRIAGGIGLIVGMMGALSGIQTRRQPGVSAPARSLSAAVVDDINSQIATNRNGQGAVRWAPTRRSWPAIVGALVIVVSFWFDGHTVSKGVRPLHSAVNSVHVVAGSVWVGGVVAIAAICWARSRSGEPVRIADLVLRFSRIATVALVAVVAAGAVMAFLVLDSVGDLAGTDWGRTFLVKTAAVAIAAFGGAYNHFRLLPLLDADPVAPNHLARLRTVLTAEAIVLVAVVVATAWLVAAAT